MQKCMAFLFMNNNRSITKTLIIEIVCTYSNIECIFTISNNSKNKQNENNL